MSAPSGSGRVTAAIRLALLSVCLALPSCATKDPGPMCDFTPPQLEWWADESGEICMSQTAAAELANYVDDLRRCVRQ